MNTAPANPWDLSARECQTLTSVIEHGCIKTAARAMGLSYRTLEVYVARAKVKMKVSNIVLAAVAFDRWVRGGAK